MSNYVFKTPNQPGNPAVCFSIYLVNPQPESREEPVEEKSGGGVGRE